MQDGAFSKAVKHLLSEGIHDPSDPAVVALLREKHPVGPIPRPLINPRGWHKDTSEEGTKERLQLIKQAILSFPPGSSAGPSGLRANYLQDILKTESTSSSLLLRSLDRFVCLCLEGRIPPDVAPFLACANLIPLKKAGSATDVRPVAVGEILRRLDGKFVMACPKTTAACQNLHSHQLGVKLPGATELIAMSIQGFVDHHQQDNDWCILQVDMRNAFNTLDRQRLLEACAEPIAEFLPWVFTCYGQPSPLFLGSSSTITSAQGVQQGDPLGPLLFSLTLQSVITSLPDDLPCNAWYLDDGHIIMKGTDVHPICSSLHSRLPAIGLHLNLKKCRIWGPAASSLDSLIPHDSIVRGMSIIPFTPDSGIKVLGTPVEHPQSSTFRLSTLQQEVDDLKKATHLLSQLGNPQKAHLLLRCCLDACRLQHLLRSMSCAPFLSTWPAADRLGMGSMPNFYPSWGSVTP
jgi:hypothetical protein